MTQSQTLDLADRDLRQRGLIPPDKLAACHALVIGVGAIGRQVALQLTAMGLPALTLVDHDTVDVVNLGPQGYMPEDLGQLKVQATSAWCQKLNPTAALEACGERFRRSMLSTLSVFNDPLLRRPVVFCCVDSIETRKIIWEATRSSASFFVDGRMSAEVIRVLSSGLPSADLYYSTTLFGREEAFVGACTAKSTIYTASIAAGLMIGQFARWLRQQAVERDLLLNLLSSELIVS